MKTSLLERQLLLSAKASDLASIVNIVKDLTTQEKASISPMVLDTVIDSIIHYAQYDRAESAYTMMMFVRAVGSSLPPAAMATMLQAIPPALPLGSAEEPARGDAFLPSDCATAH